MTTTLITGTTTMKHSRRTFLGMVGGTAAGAAVAGAGIYGLTGLYEGSAEASETTDDVVEMSGGANAELDGVNSPEATKLTPFKDALHLNLRG
ncbi:hypothetical protein MBT84_43935 [Streptomyces sp. MBT84]|nr:hypothetical protein [Streptomyces sp. MBT84]